MYGPSLEFTQARFKHLNWKFKLRSFLDGKETITEQQAISPHECDLGKWLYSSGLEKYKQYPEMCELEKIHESMHSLIKRIVDLNQKGLREKAKAEYVKVELISEQIIGLLDILETKTKR